jgi:RimJ/RimL family protein N-acetyltransferase
MEVTIRRATEKWAFEKGITRIELNVWGFNKRAMAFYDNLGYKPQQHILGKSLVKRK